MSVEASAPAASLDDVVRLLSEQNELLKKIAESAKPSPKDSRLSEADWARAKAIAAKVEPSEEAAFVVVDAETGAFAVGRTMSAAAERLGAPPERSMGLRAGGGTLRLRSPGRFRA